MNNQQNKTITDEQFVQLMNEIVNDPNPKPRINMATDLCHSLRHLLYYHRPVLEQFVAKLEQDFELIQHPPDFGHPLMNEIVKTVVPKAKRNAAQCLGLLKAYLDIRPYFVDAVRKNVQEAHQHPDWEYDL